MSVLATTDSGCKPADEKTETISAQTCEQCGNEFTPRSSGGRQQRFCGPNCRRAFHDKPQRDNVHVARSGLPAVIDPPTPETASEATDDDFAWTDLDAIALAEQYETAVYWNPRGQMVIRQRHWPDDDSLIFVSRNNVHDFLDKICDAVGIPSAKP